MKKIFSLYLLVWLLTINAYTQITGGQHSFEFLNLSNSPHVSSLGGINITHPGNDVSFFIQNPALLREDLHNQIAVNYNAYYAGIKCTNLTYAYHLPKIKTTFGIGIQHLNYGSFDLTDAYGNLNGTFHATDYCLNFSAAKKYLNRWQYGATAKWAHADYIDKKATALLADVGVVYIDTSNLLTLGVSAKNMGIMVKSFSAKNPEPLPFDLQLGLTKRFKHLPLKLSLTAHHLYQWNISYNNPNDIATTSLFGNASTTNSKSSFSDKLFRHLIFSGEFSLGQHLTLGIGYNHLHRKELAIKDRTAMAGFSFGLNAEFPKLQIHYGRNYYHITGAYNELGINFPLNKMGNKNKKNNWHNQNKTWSW